MHTEKNTPAFVTQKQLIPTTKSKIRVLNTENKANLIVARISEDSDVAVS